MNPSPARNPFERRPAAERGVVMVVVAIAMLALLALGGLALDMGHAYVDKARLQNALDASALSGAKTLDLNPGELDMARTSAINTFRLTAAGDGNDELNDEVTNAELDIRFYATISPLAGPVEPDNSDARYVRVAVTAFDKPMILAQVLPGIGDTMAIGGSAMAGPSPRILDLCNVVPILVCANDPDDVPAGDDPETVYGYDVGEEYRLTLEPGTESDVGPGNFRLLAMGGTGASVLRDNLAGGFDGCLDDEATEAETEPGVNEGPVAQGLNTRMGEYSGGGVNPTDHPPDTNTCQTPTLATPHYTYDEYNSNPNCVEDSAGSVQRMAGRRVLAIPMADCSGDDSGRSTLPLIDTTCMFMTQRVRQGGDPAERGVYAEMMPGGCLAAGVPGPDPGAGPGPHTIQLYHDPLSDES